jgi:hypothetical protein
MIIPKENEKAHQQIYTAVSISAPRVVLFEAKRTIDIYML